MKMMFGALVVLYCLVSQVCVIKIAEELRTGHLLPMYNTVQDLAACNSAMNDRVGRARAAVTTLERENTQLKASLKESVEMLQEEIVYNDELSDELRLLRWWDELLGPAEEVTP